MKKAIKLSDFDFQFSGHGHYKVIYTSKKTGKQWHTVTSDMPLIDATKNEDNPSQSNLNTLKWICKNK